MIDPTDEDIFTVVQSTTVKMKFACGSAYLIANDLNGKLLRVFLKKGHSGLCVQALLEAIGRLLTIMVQQTDLDMARVWKTLVGITCESGSPFVDGMSCVDGVAKKLREMYPQRFETDWESPDEEEPCAPTD